MNLFYLRNMKVNFCLLILLFTGQTYAALNEECLTPNNETARCISIYECDVFLHNIKNRTKEVVTFMRQSKCGTGGPPHHDVLVCCGSTVTYAPQNMLLQPEPRNSLTDSFKNLLPPEKLCGISGFITRIVGGEETNLDDYPWMARLEYKKDNKSTGFNCGGSLINSRYVLTAAHCLVGAIQFEVGNLYSVRLGEHDIRTNPDERKGQGMNEPYQDILVEEAIPHQEYSKGDNEFTTRQDDIALLRLSREVEFSGYRLPICLPIHGEKATMEDILVVAGWGVNDLAVREYSPVKMHVNLTLFDEKNCSYYNPYLTQRQICAGGEKGKDSCNGDSGGPLMNIIPNTDRWYMEGIVSYGPNECGTEGQPGIYVKVSEYLDWIQKNMRP